MCLASTPMLPIPMMNQSQMSKIENLINSHFPESTSTNDNSKLRCILLNKYFANNIHFLPSLVRKCFLSSFLRERELSYLWSVESNKERFCSRMFFSKICIFLLLRHCQHIDKINKTRRRGAFHQHASLMRLLIEY